MSIVKSLDVGNGDMFYIKHNSDNFTIIDCNMNIANRGMITEELRRESADKRVWRFISTHPDDDHIQGLAYLDENMGIFNFYCVKNATTKEDETEDFLRYCELRNKERTAFHIYKDCSRPWMNEDDEVYRFGSAEINILWPDIANSDYKEALAMAKNGGSPNNISPIIMYKASDSATILWFGDMEKSFMEKILDKVQLPKADIIFAPHHGRKSGKIPVEWLRKMDPKIIVLGNAPSDELDYSYSREYNTITQNSAGDIIFNCRYGAVDIYVSKPNYSVDFLKDEKKWDTDTFEYTYLGTLSV